MQANRDGFNRFFLIGSMNRLIDAIISCAAGTGILALVGIDDKHLIERCMMERAMRFSRAGVLLHLVPQLVWPQAIVVGIE